MPPYELPANKTRSGVKTDSSLGSGGFNEIRFEDKKGSEQIFIHGQLDSDTRIENDAREWIGEDRHLIVKRDKYEEVDQDIHIDIKRNHMEKIAGDRNLTVQGQEAIQISGSQSLQVTGNVVEKFGAGHTEQAQSIVLQAETSICLTVGGNFISIGPAGITMVGSPMVLINSGGAPVPGMGSGVSPVLPLAPMVADGAVAGTEVVYIDDGQFSDFVPSPPVKPKSKPIPSKRPVPKPWIPPLPAPRIPPPPSAASPSPDQSTFAPEVQQVRQAATLISASADGVPFCEECARSAGGETA
jgi:hypothetical protein